MIKAKALFPFNDEEFCMNQSDGIAVTSYRCPGSSLIGLFLLYKRPMKYFVTTAFMIGVIALQPRMLYGVEILDADPHLSSRFTGRPEVDEHFGNQSFDAAESSNYLLGSSWYTESREGRGRFRLPFDGRLPSGMEKTAKSTDSVQRH